MSICGRRTITDFQSASKEISAIRSYLCQLQGGGSGGGWAVTGTTTLTGDVVIDGGAFAFSLSNSSGASLAVGVPGGLERVSLSSTGNGSITIGASGLFVEDDSGTPRGLQYDGNYTATFNTRSLVDKGYVDAAIAASAATSPLTLTSTAVGQIPLTIVGAASQTGHLQEWKNNAGTVVAYIGNGGGLKINGVIDNNYIGVGMEIEQNGAGQGVIRNYNRTGGSYNDFLLEGLALLFRPSGVTAFNVTGSGTYAGGSAAANSTFQVGGSFSTAYTAKTGTYPITASDHTINCTANTFTVTLPTAVGCDGRQYFITNSGAGTITIATTSSQTFANVVATPTTLTIVSVGAKIVQSNGANWLLISTS